MRGYSQSQNFPPDVLSQQLAVLPPSRPVDFLFLSARSYTFGTLAISTEQHPEVSVVSYKGGGTPTNPQNSH